MPQRSELQQISNLTSKYGAGHERRQQINWSTKEFEVCHYGFSLMYVEIRLSNVTDKWIWWLGHSARTYLRLPWKPLIEVDGSTLYVINAESKVSSYAESQIGSFETTKASIGCFGFNLLLFCCCHWMRSNVECLVLFACLHWQGRRSLQDDSLLTRLFLTVSACPVNTLDLFQLNKFNHHLWY